MFSVFSLLFTFLPLCPRMDSDDSVLSRQFRDFLQRVFSQSGGDEIRLAETLDCLAEHGGWRPSTNVSAPDTQGRGGALQFYKVVIQA